MWYYYTQHTKAKFEQKNLSPNLQASHSLQHFKHIIQQHFRVSTTKNVFVMIVLTKQDVLFTKTNIMGASPLILDQQHLLLISTNQIALRRTPQHTPTRN